MFKSNLDDTIAAISTPLGESGSGIVRMSGKDTLRIADRTFVSKDGKTPSKLPTFTTHYGHIVDDGVSRIDEVILTIMRAPKTYTREDIVEVNCHGGITCLKKVLDLVVGLGARLAQPGEFTKRAYLNGRIDLVQAEAVLDVIHAKTDASLRVALNQLEGELSREIRSSRGQLLDILANIEAGIDFPEEDIEVTTLPTIRENLKATAMKVERLLATADRGQVLREGITAAILGRQNVGKSSLMNAILRRDRAIVTSIPGTTRDTIEEIADIGQIPVRLVDTAGIVETIDLIARKGVQRSQMYLARADLILLVLDGSKPLTDEDRRLLADVRTRPTIVVINKIDLDQKIELEEVRENLPNRRITKISATQRIGLDLLEDAITQMVWKGEVLITDEPLITNVRHKDALVKALQAIERTTKGMDKGLGLELIAIDIKEAFDSLGEIVGEVVTEDLLDRIFSEFCIGK